MSRSFLLRIWSPTTPWSYGSTPIGITLQTNTSLLWGTSALSCRRATPPKSLKAACASPRLPANGFAGKTDRISGSMCLTQNPSLSCIRRPEWAPPTRAVVLLRDTGLMSTFVTTQRQFYVCLVGYNEPLKSKSVQYSNERRKRILNKSCPIGLTGRKETKMKKYSTEELTEILQSHKEWLFGDPDGERACLNGADLSGVDLQNAYLNGVNLEGADLREANLSGASLSGANLEGANLQGADLREAYLGRANLHGAILRATNFEAADLALACLTDADMSGAQLKDANLSGASLRSANLLGANLQSAFLKFSNFVGADLREANLRRAVLDGANLEGALLGEMQTYLV